MAGRTIKKKIMSKGKKKKPAAGKTKPRKGSSYAKSMQKIKKKNKQ